MTAIARNRHVWMAARDDHLSGSCQMKLPILERTYRLSMVSVGVVYHALSCFVSGVNYPGSAGFVSFVDADRLPKQIGIVGRNVNPMMNLDGDRYRKE